MSKTNNWLVHDHRKYEAALEECEMAAGAGDWKDAIRLFTGFVEELKLHMRMEDEVLYPAFIEEVSGAASAIADLSEEHDHIAQLLHDLAYVIKRNDMDHFEDSLIPLYRAMKSHNEHEEHVFLDMGNDALLMRRDEIMARLQSLESNTPHRSWDF